MAAKEVEEYWMHGKTKSEGFSHLIQQADTRESNVVVKAFLMSTTDFSYCSCHSPVSVRNGPAMPMSCRWACSHADEIPRPEILSDNLEILYDNFVPGVLPYLAWAAMP